MSSHLRGGGELSCCYVVETRLFINKRLFVKMPGPFLCPNRSLVLVYIIHSPFWLLETEQSYNIDPGKKYLSRVYGYNYNSTTISTYEVPLSEDSKRIK